ncbi:MAG: hypothetical protein DHS20C17_28160 [Cyclobacteriaceae bacterium]|nr:MAG: hypothetical protein DHS20C17_28160 [Cyclobacteriaceae bacterium]
MNSSAPKYQHSFTTSAELDQLQLQLERLIEQDRVYTQSDITLNRLAEMLHSDRHTVSRLINERYDKNFFHFINAYRIRDFVQQVTRVRNKDKTFLELAYAVGFSNKTSFIRAFKRENHQTPSQYFRGSET